MCGWMAREALSLRGGGTMPVEVAIRVTEKAAHQLPLMDGFPEFHLFLREPGYLLFLCITGPSALCPGNFFLVYRFGNRLI